MPMLTAQQLIEKFKPTENPFHIHTGVYLPDVGWFRVVLEVNSNGAMAIAQVGSGPITREMTNETAKMMSDLRRQEATTYDDRYMEAILDRNPVATYILETCDSEVTESYTSYLQRFEKEEEERRRERNW